MESSTGVQRGGWIVNCCASIKASTLYDAKRVSRIGQHFVRQPLGKKATLKIAQQQPVIPPTAALHQLRKPRR